DHLAVALHPLTMKWRQQEPPLAHVRRPVKSEERARADQRFEKRVAAGPNLEGLRIGGEYRLDRLGIRHRYDVLTRRHPQREDGAVALSATLQERVWPQEPPRELHDSGGRGARRKP